MELNAWTHGLRTLSDKAVSLYRKGNHAVASYFTADEQALLASIGLKPVNVYDYAEDQVGSGEPDWDTFLLIAAARRDYFLYVQNGQLNPAELTGDELPPKKAALGGIEWLPRLIKKARCFLDGGLRADIMYGCSGDRNFFKCHSIHPADFLRAVWSSRGDDEKILSFVRSRKPL